jgi:hypothetical protein
MRGREPRDEKGTTRAGRVHGDPEPVGRPGVAAPPNRVTGTP